MNKAKWTSYFMVGQKTSPVYRSLEMLQGVNPFDSLF